MNTTERIRRTTTTHGTERPVPVWASYVAHAIPLLLLPQCLWRLPFAFGFEMGIDTDEPMPSAWITVPYIFGLSLTTEAFALLCFGLVRSWGEVVPAWVPFIGGRRVAPWAALVPATLGGIAATALWVPGVLGWFGTGDSADYTSTGWEILAKVCIAPGTLWGPLVLVLTYAYYQRRCRPATDQEQSAAPTPA
ncbi:hypothetical protein AAHZ94_35855 [Streptomyces sp. HSW2009]|uniref:hypothetical protein n=1 Tax=Streptomyces sp. HSW2009 TaxID=3142890 RepID=UPI0032EA8FF6